jgi:SAM-dependent methyltransferase
MSTNESPRCYLCGGTEHQVVAREFRYPIEKTGYRCATCSLVFIHPPMSPEEERRFYEEEYGIIYSQEKNTTPADLFEARQDDARMYRDWVAPWLTPTDDCLEIGCASGYFLAVIKDEVRSVAGLESHLELRRYCTQIGLAIHDRLEDLPAASIDRVFAFFVLEHLGAPLDFLAEAKRVCRPGGSIMIVVPNVDDVLLSTYDIPKFDSFYFTPAHQFYYSRDTLSRLFVQAGLPTHEILPKQRYDLSNHMHWMLAGRPGGMGKYDHIFGEPLRQAYADELTARFLCDTLFAVVTVEAE